jgi:hypothetical protein
MPLTFGIPLGLVVILLGITIAFGLRRRRAGLAIAMLGITIALATAFLIALVMLSPM